MVVSAWVRWVPFQTQASGAIHRRYPDKPAIFYMARGRGTAGGVGAYAEVGSCKTGLQGLTCIKCKMCVCLHSNSKHRQTANPLRKKLSCARVIPFATDLYVREVGAFTFVLAWPG